MTAGGHGGTATARAIVKSIGVTVDEKPVRDWGDALRTLRGTPVTSFAVNTCPPQRADADL